MNGWHTAFSREAFAAPPQLREIGGWRVEFLGFSGPAAGRAPLLCLGGAFQSRWSFRHVAERLLPDHPVAVVDLPGQGNNTQDSQALDFDGFADLLERFCQRDWSAWCRSACPTARRWRSRSPRAIRGAWTS